MIRRRPTRPAAPGAQLAAAARVTALAAAALLVAACGAGASTPDPAASHPVSPEASTMAAPTSFPAGFTLTSSAFADGAPIPPEHSCRGADVSPPLAWRGVPAGTAALVVFVDDPDGRDWVHWSVLDLPPADGELSRGVAPQADLQQGRNDFGRVGYGGPCPPSGTHHYRFTLYALAAPLALPGHPDGTAVRAALRTATILGQTTLIGTFRA